MGGKSVRINADPDISLTVRGTDPGPDYPDSLVRGTDPGPDYTDSLVRGTDPGPDYPDSFSQRYGSGAGFFYHQAKIFIVC